MNVMMYKRTYRFAVMVAMMLAVVQFAGSFKTYGADDQDKKRQELMRKIQELEDQKRKEREKFVEKEEKTKPTGKSLQEVIARYEKLLAGCTGKKNDRCSDVLATLASLYYDEARDNYIEARSNYERSMDVWEKSRKGPEPVNPLPDYSKSLKMYEQLIKEYPEFNRVDEAYYQIGAIALVTGDLDKAEQAFKDVVVKVPNSRRASAAYFRLADFAFMRADYSQALKSFEKVKNEDLTLENLEMAHARKAEIYYNMAEFDKAVELFFSYVENCDKGMYKKCEFKPEALEFLAISFSDMTKGGEEAVKFFKRVGSRPYEDYVLYTIGMKNRVHGQYDDAIVALGVALKRFPYYKDAPTGQQALVECYLIKKQYDEANAARERLVDFYATGGEWYAKNQGEKAVIEKSRNEIRMALAAIPIYYHVKAQKSKDRSMFEKALKRYEEFFTKFPDDLWKVYEFKNYVAEIYNTLGDFEKAAQYYDYVAMQDLSTYPAQVIEIDTFGLDQEQVEKLKAEAKKGTRAISQEDAGYNVIVALDNGRKKAIARDGLSDEQALNSPETKKFLDYIHTFQKRFPQSANAAEVLYLAGNVYYSAKSYQNAVNEFQILVNNYPSLPIANKAMRMLANSYASMGEYDLAQAKYKELLSKTAPNSSDYAEIVDLAAGAMFKKGEGMKKSGNLMGAVDAFKAIYSSFPNSKVADRGWFEAAATMEESANIEGAAGLFESFTEKFPKSTLIEGAFARAAEAYKKLKKYEQAAQVYIRAANTVPKAEFAIGMLAAAADAYQQIEKFDLAGKMYELVYERYSNDPKTPMALYNAGLVFEKGKLYENAIKVYTVLSGKFAQSEYAAEAFFSMGLCYEKMNRNSEMADLFTEYAKRYTNDRYKPVEALVKAGDAYFNMKKFDDAEKNYTLATIVHKEYGKKADIDLSSVAKAYFMTGEIKYQSFLAVKLTGGSEKDVNAAMKEKIKVLEEAGKPYSKAIEIGVANWTMRATYRIGEGFVDMADAVANQKLFGSSEQQIASKIKILSSLEKYYNTAQEYFFKNIDWAYNQGITGEYVDRSKENFMKMAYLKGHIMEEVGLIFKNAPIPKGLEPEEVTAYKEVLEEKMLEAMDAALPKFEEGLQAAAELGIAKSEWLDKIRERVSSINPESQALNIEIKERVTVAKPETGAVQGSRSHASASAGTTAAAQGEHGSDEEFNRNMQRIRNIMNMEISADDKVKQLSRIEMEAQRNIVLEEERIKELKGQ